MSYMINQLKVFHKTYELIKELHGILKKFPKSEKYTIVKRIENRLLDILEGLMIANTEVDKLNSLNKINLDLDILRVLIRLSKDFRYISFLQYELIIKQVDEIGRMVGGMIKKFSSG